MCEYRHGSIENPICLDTWVDLPELYRIQLGNVGNHGLGDVFLIRAYDMQDALDKAFDYAEEQGWDGLFLDDDDADEFDVLIAGNSGRQMLNTDVHVHQIPVR